VRNIPHERLGEKRTGEETNTIKQKVLRARKIQERRFKNTKRKIKRNSDMSSRELAHYVPLEENVKKELNSAATNLDLSPRAYHRVIKLARTIADLDEKESVEESHILESLQYRPKKL